MAPLSCQPAVIEVEPSDDGTNVKGTVYWVEDVWGTGHASAIRDGCAWNDGAQKLGAGWEFESFETAAKGVEEDESSSVDLAMISVQWTSLAYVLFAYSQIRVDFVVVDVVGHILDLGVVLGLGPRGGSTVRSHCGGESSCGLDLRKERSLRTGGLLHESARGAEWSCAAAAA